MHISNLCSPNLEVDCRELGKAFGRYPQRQDCIIPASLVSVLAGQKATRSVGLTAAHGFLLFCGRFLVGWRWRCLRNSRMQKQFDQRVVLKFRERFLGSVEIFFQRLIFGFEMRCLFL